jgi:fatty acid desaturase
MHHVEENLPEDLSSTMSFRRDSFFGWLRYFFRFFLGTLFDITLYLLRKKRYKLLIRFIAGELGYYLFIIFLCTINFTAALFVFILPFIFCRGAMIAGNWAQHAFIDPLHPEDPYLNSINVINCRYNKRCYNDGYHIGHHLKPRLHWTEMPKDLEANIDLYRNREAIIFEGIDFIMVWGLLMLKRYDILARHFIDLSTHKRTQKDIIAFLKSRIMPIPVEIQQSFDNSSKNR